MRYVLLSSLLLSLNLHAFTSDECFKANFNTKVKGNTKYFGILKNILKLSKEDCLITVTQEGLIEKRWKIDICRNPIHIKVLSNGSEDFYKRISDCVGKENDFCQFSDQLNIAVENIGLIYADGLKENINDDHGKVYCSYLLIQKYLISGHVFSTSDQSVDIFTKKEEACELPVKESSQTIMSSTPEEPVIIVPEKESEIKKSRIEF